MFIVEKHNPKNKYDYVAMKYIVKLKQDETGRVNETIDDRFHPLYVRLKRPSDTDTEVFDILNATKCFEHNGEKIGERFMMLPTLNRPDEEERDVLYLSASAGSGKSYLVNQFAEIYNKLYPDRKIYFLTTNNFEKDKSLNHRLYKPIDITKFLTQLQGNLMSVSENPPKEFQKSLWIFDDIGTIASNKHLQKVCWNFIDVMLENYRKYLVSICICSHIPTDYVRTRCLVRESKQYIVFPSNLQVRSDRFLKDYLGLNREQVHIITDEMDDSRWVAVFCKKKFVMSQYQMRSLK